MIGNRYEYDAMAWCERDLWWFKCLHKLTIAKIRKYSPVENPAILDAGCGTGGLIQHLKENGFSKVTGFDLSPDAIDHAQAVDPDIIQLDLLETDRAFEEDSFDVVVCNDIFTVLPPGKDRVALQKLMYVLKPGGVLIMNLAALSAFAGIHDLAVNMTARYNKPGVRKLADNLSIVKEFVYWPFALSPFIFAARCLQRLKLFLNRRTPLVSDVKRIPGPLNRLFYLITKADTQSPFPKPWGSSLMVVLQKPEVYHSRLKKESYSKVLQD